MSRLIVIPLSVRILGAERYGLWISIGSLIAWLGLSEAGLGLGLINALGSAHGRDDRKAMRRDVATVAISLLAVSVIILAATWWYAARGPLEGLLGIQDREALVRDARGLMWAGGLVFALTFAANVFPQVAMGLQQQYLASYASNLGSIGAILSVTAFYFSGGSPAAFVLALGMPPVLANLGLGMYLLFSRHPDLRFGIRDFSLQSLRSLMTSGVQAFAIQLGELAIIQSANVLIANRLGPASVTPFATTYSLLFFGMTMVNSFVLPLWPAYGEAWARGDTAWIRRRFRQNVRLAGSLMILGALACVTLGRPFIRVWAGSAAVPSWALLLALAAYFVTWTVNGAVAILANGLGLFGYRALSVVLAGAWFVFASWNLLPRAGVAAVPVVGVSVMLVEGLVAWTQVRRRMRDAERRPGHRGQLSPGVD